MNNTNLTGAQAPQDERAIGEESMGIHTPFKKSTEEESKTIWKENFNIINEYMEANPSQRLGQAIFNCMATSFLHAEALCATDVDCFYRDELIIPFMEEFLKREGEEPIFPYQAWAESKLAKHPLKYNG